MTMFYITFGAALGVTVAALLVVLWWRTRAPSAPAEYCITETMAPNFRTKVTLRAGRYKAETSYRHGSFVFTLAEGIQIEREAREARERLIAEYEEWKAMQEADGDGEEDV